MILSRTTRAAHQRERAELLRTLQTVGADAPTLCEGWTARTLAAHIVVSEQQAGVPLTVSYPIWRATSARTADVLLRSVNRVGDRRMAQAEARGWDWLLRRLEAGPPRLFALRMIAEVRLLEEFIHHEDVRRANGPEPRMINEHTAERLVAGMLAISEFALFSDARNGIEVHLPDGQSYCVGSGDPTARVSGDVGEVALWLAGRGSAARVDVDGEVPRTALRV